MWINLLHLMWISYSFIVVFFGLHVLYVRSVPFLVRRLYTFGKINREAAQRRCAIDFIEVPKRWFSHFYLFAVIFIPYIAIAVQRRYYGGHSDYFLTYLLDTFASTNRSGVVMPESVIIVSILVSLQVCRRCFECLFISVYSDSKMNILHYIVGFTFYFGMGLSLIHDAPGFESPDGYNEKAIITDEWYKWYHIVGTVMFLVAFCAQFHAHKALADLRKKGGAVVSKEHHIPVGGLFEYVSCPHYFSEIVMYFSACLILGCKSFSWWLVCLWILSNQIATGLLCHQWYMHNFKHYPVQRKAVIPFLL